MHTLAYWLSLVLISAIAWENMLFFEGLGTLGRGIGILTAMFWTIKVAVKGRFRRPHAVHVVIGLFVLWTAASVFWSLGVEETVISIITYLQLAILVLMLWDLYTTPAALRAGLQAYVLGAYVSVVGTIANYLTTTEGNRIRYAAAGFNPNKLGLILALGIPVAWHLALSGSNHKWSHVLRLVNYVYIPAAILAILLTASRGTLVAAMPAIVYIVGSLGRLRLLSRVAISGALVAALLVLLPLVPQGALERLGTTADSIVEGDIGDRASIWREGVGVFALRPLVGVGSGVFPLMVESGRVAHNSYLSVLVDIGLVGFVLFAIILATAAYSAIRQTKKESMFWVTLLLVLYMGNFVHAWEKKKPTWLFLGFAIASAHLTSGTDQAKLLSDHRAESDSVSHFSYRHSRLVSHSKSVRDRGVIKTSVPRTKESAMPESAQVAVCCPNEICKDYGRLQGDQQHNIIKYGHTDAGRQRFRCKTCGKTFTETRGTIFYRRRTPEKEILDTLALIALGNEIHSLARSRGHRKETIKTWLRDAGKHVEAVENRLYAEHQLTRKQLDTLWAYVCSFPLPNNAEHGGRPS